MRRLLLTVLTFVLVNSYRVAPFTDAHTPFYARGSEYPLVIENAGGNCADIDNVACFAVNTTTQVRVGSFAYASEITHTASSGSTCNVFVVPCSMTTYSENYALYAYKDSSWYSLNISNFYAGNAESMPANDHNVTTGFLAKSKRRYSFRHHHRRHRHHRRCLRCRLHRHPRRLHSHRRRHRLHRHLLWYRRLQSPLLRRRLVTLRLHPVHLQAALLMNYKEILIIMGISLLRMLYILLVCGLVRFR